MGFFVYVYFCFCFYILFRFVNNSSHYHCIEPLRKLADMQLPFQNVYGRGFFSLIPYLSLLSNESKMLLFHLCIFAFSAG